jgi:hypothetical protein
MMDDAAFSITSTYLCTAVVLSRESKYGNVDW